MNRSTCVHAAALAAILGFPGASLMAQGTLERIADRGEFRIGYNPDARPLSFTQNGEAAGYSVDLCRRIAAGVREHLKLPDMKVTFIATTIDKRFDAIEDGDIDIECGSSTITLDRQERVDFTLMTFVTGGTLISMANNRVATMADLNGKRVAVLRNTSTETALKAHLSENSIDARVITVSEASEGLARLQDGGADAYASDQAVLVGAALRALETDRNASFSFAEEMFSYEPYGFMVRRNDAEFRLVANRVLAQLYRSGQFAQLYQEWIGSVGIKPSPMLIAMYQLNALTE
jgi:ABC-type amino acid transport substrate-binding protein